MEGQKIIGYDFDTLSMDGSDNLTQTLMELLNDYPEMQSVPAKYIEFQLLDTTSGIAMFPKPSIAILSERESITGHVKQTCVYGFTIVYRTRSNYQYKESIKEWLDNLGRWLERQEVNGNKLEEYPALAGDREFIKISRNTQSYPYGTTEDKAEDWAIEIQATYRNEFDR